MPASVNTLNPQAEAMQKTSPSLASWRRRLVLGGATASVLSACSMASRTVPQHVGQRPQLGPEALATQLQESAIAVAEKSPRQALETLNDTLENTVGHRLFTLLLLNWRSKENQRYFSNQASAYPTGGAKPLYESGWFYERVIMGGQAVIHHQAGDLIKAFPDHELIRSLGCDGGINFPIRFRQQTIGSLNLFHEAHWYSDKDIPTLTIVAGLIVPALLNILETIGN